MKKQNTQQPEAINIEEVVGKSEAVFLSEWSSLCLLRLRLTLLFSETEDT